MYEVRQCGDEENWDKCLITAIDLTKTRMMNNRDYIDIHYYPNSVELVHKYKLVEGKTIAEIICDNNGCFTDKYLTLQTR